MKKTSDLLKIFDLRFWVCIYHTSELEFELSKTTFFAKVMMIFLEKTHFLGKFKLNSKYSTHTLLKLALKVSNP